ncbi:hypothetical protein VTL71DRAFT_8317 [Oculimacula yallundae]|uniref:Uncharacterized protein n=1 Tax=Oculimacula yallundae TaxID=86028 RepID=A0ABR4CZN3_9HELO
MAPSTNNIAFTAPINPPGASPILTRSQIWAMHRLKIESAEIFVPGAISSTSVLSTSTSPETGNTITIREVTFIEGNRKVKETVTEFEDCRVEFEQEDGSRISNIVSDGEGGLYLTFVFEWKHPGVEGAELAKWREKEQAMSRKAVEGTIEAMRRLVREGKY